MSVCVVATDECCSVCADNKKHSQIDDDDYDDI